MANVTHPHEETYAEFKNAVNLTASELERWLETDESKRVGQKTDGQSESTGHQEGRRIIEILRKKKADLTEDDYAHMRKVIGYVARHSKQGPHDQADVETSDWRYSLKNWGHDPQK